LEPMMTIFPFDIEPPERCVVHRPQGGTALRLAPSLRL
jgi:hypothetical protein